VYTACARDTKILLLDSDDVGKFAAAAISSPEKFNGKEIDLGTELLTVAEIAEQVGNVAGLNIEVRYYDEEESLALIDKRAVVGHERMFNQMVDYIHITPAEYGIKMNLLFGVSSEREGSALYFLEFDKTLGLIAGQYMRLVSLLTGSYLPITIAGRLTLFFAINFSPTSPTQNALHKYAPPGINLDL
jgi:hypothetical protein